MAENKRPLNVVDSPPKYINFSTTKKQRIIAKNNNKILQSPMVGDRNYNAGGVATKDDCLSVLVDPARMQLISPPPEEMLRKNQRLSAQFTPSSLANTGTSQVNPSTHATSTAAKRKRTQPAPASSTPPSRDVDLINQDKDLGVQSPQVMEATPNPKPRKQGRLHSRQPSFDSPTRKSFGHLGSSPVSNDDISKQHTPSRPKVKKVLVKSPHAKNPDADFIDDIPLPTLLLPAAKASGSALRRTLLGAKSSRRSATPIPPYEPPRDVFTPPREVFLSPVLTKSMSKSSKRKSVALTSGSKSAKGKKKVSTLSIVTGVKQELPDIDLSLPMPPPSPTDDPLLLSGPPELDPEPTPTRREMSVQAQADQEVGFWHGDLPPSSPESPLATDDVEAVRVFDWGRTENAAPEISTDESMMQLDPDDAGISPVRLFDSNDVPPSSNGGWTDSEDEGGQGSTVAPGGMEEGEEGEGEYTGHWKMMLVRTKQDPPSSATRGRMEEWGRPISPFPRKVARLAFLEEEEGEEGHQEEDHQQVGRQQEDDNMRREEEEREEEEVRRMSVEPEQLLGNVADSAEDADDLRDEQVLELSGKVRTEPIIPHDIQWSSHGLLPDIQQEEEEEEEREVRQLSVEFDDDEEPASPFDNLDPAPLQFTENLACGNQAESIPTVQPRLQPSPAPAVELVDFPSIGSSPEVISYSHSTGPEHRNTPAAVFNENHRTQTVVWEQEDDDQSSDDGDESSIVKISSADPRAAARAAAILKQHDYDCYTNIEIKRRHLEAKHRRNSHSDIEDFAKESRRRSVSSSGVTKASNSRRRRSTLGMGVIGDRVFIPGSPAITLPELLQEAELEVRDGPQSPRSSLVLAGTGTGRGDPFKTPIATKYRAQTGSTRMAGQKAEVYGSDVGEREWTKEDWKYLDACFTDQRLEVGSRLAGAEDNLLAPVDVVSINDVVDKFVDSMGGFETVARFGALWSRENLSERTRALQKKQRSGHVAPPTTPYTPLSVGNNNNVLGGKERAPRMQVPDFTPLGRRAAPPRKSRPTLQQPITHDVAPEDLTPEQEGPIIPPTLLAPRYSHLLEEAINISQQGSILSPGQETQVSFPQPEVEDTPHSCDVPSTTIGKRVKGLLFSYLPTLSKSSSTTKKALNPLQPSLPLPPIDILSKPRGPVVTPARAPLPKPKHPKELVVLNPAPQATRISHIPRVIKPRRLVELHPPAPSPMIEPTPIPRPRRSSGNSVKDLVRDFEELRTLAHDKLKRTKSNECGKRYADRRPQWKP
ncbi:hypothetical protein BYT27DRAFT_6941902 [Phlegmacium glaucopus]|nr:hypothetical protein BYT27DRAFT_6941902 [Phlegmacium glaucopus]